MVGRGAPPKVALLIESSRAYGRGILGGIAKYIRQHGHWVIFMQEQSLCDEPPPWLAGWQGDGIISRIDNPALAACIARLRVPTVYLRNVSPGLKVPSIVTDNDAISRVAFEHLRERGFRRFAYCGYNGADYSDERRDAFASFVSKAGLRCDVFHPAQLPEQLSTAVYEEQGLRDGDQVARWIQALPKPVGLMACNDMRGRQVLDACRAIGATVPEEVAVVGVDNEEVLCELSNPPLSSVIPNTERVGYNAAATLAAMMAGTRTRPRRALVEPLGVQTRRSTDVLAIEDRQVAAAARFIREHACDGIHIGDVLRAVGMSRSTLERRYHKLLGHSPKHDLLRFRLDRAKQLLAETDFPVARVAEKLGFEHTEYLNVIFKKKTGLTPARFRAYSRVADRSDRLPG
ncbi:MAG TPA: DNA-binding transcriptional regulator [Candidatus Acidoferrum sp.]|nr:DNA-binding transcriptional regulator [Candidatus Acidoferrum sp.]